MLKNLKTLRTQAGLSQQKLADIIGTSQQSINKYENQNIEPDIDTLIKLSDIFNTSVDYIIGNTDITDRIELKTPFELNDDESALINKYRKINKSQKKCIHNIIDNFIE